jgi:RNA polymerase primary sigma factor
MIALHGHSLRKTNRKRSRAIPKQSQARVEKPSTLVDYIHSKEFESRAADRAIIREFKRTSPPSTESEKVPRASGNQAYFAGLYEVPLLSAGDERELFRRFNYLKFKANRLIRSQTKLSAKNRKQYERFIAEANGTREQLVRANLRLVISIAKRFVNADNSFDDLVSDGNLALIRAVEKFNYELGNRFSTYATYAIQRAVFRAISQRRLRNRRFIADDAGLDAVVGDEEMKVLNTLQISSLHELLEEMFAELDAREQHIVRKRFGFDNSEPKSFKELGDEMGVCKERVRQIQTRAIGKLLRMARDRSLEQYLDPGQF